MVDDDKSEWTSAGWQARLIVLRLAKKKAEREGSTPVTPSGREKTAGKVEAEVRVIVPRPRTSASSA